MLGSKAQRDTLTTLCFVPDSVDERYRTAWTCIVRGCHCMQTAACPFFAKLAVSFASFPPALFEQNAIRLTKSQARLVLASPHHLPRVSFSHVRQSVQLD